MTLEKHLATQPSAKLTYERNQNNIPSRQVYSTEDAKLPNRKTGFRNESRKTGIQTQYRDSEKQSYRQGSKSHRRRHAPYEKAGECFEVAERCKTKSRRPKNGCPDYTKGRTDAFTRNSKECGKLAITFPKGVEPSPFVRYLKQPSPKSQSRQWT